MLALALGDDQAVDEKADLQCIMQRGPTRARQWLQQRLLCCWEAAEGL